MGSKHIEDAQNERKNFKGVVLFSALGFISLQAKFLLQYYVNWEKVSSTIWTTNHLTSVVNLVMIKSIAVFLLLDHCLNLDFDSGLRLSSIVTCGTQLTMLWLLRLEMRRLFLMIVVECIAYGVRERMEYTYIGSSMMIIKSGMTGKGKFKHEICRALSSDIFVPK